MIWHGFWSKAPHDLVQPVGLEMAVAHRHRDGLVPEDRLERGDVAAALEELAGELVTQGMAAMDEASPTGQLPELCGELAIAVAITATDQRLESIRGDEQLRKAAFDSGADF